MKKIRTLIVDDEPVARRGIHRELERDPEVLIVGECADGYQAVAAIREKQPQLIFLDLQMPELDGFGVIESIGSEAMPMVIFVTAYDQHALRAFELHALDYLLKPFTRERFQRALQHAKKQMGQRVHEGLSERLLALLQESPTLRQPGEPAKYIERLVVKSDGRIFFLHSEEIHWIEAADNYVRLHTGKESHLIQGTMNRLESRLNPDSFLRIHRSAIVNINYIKELQPLFHGEYVVHLASGKELTSGRTYRENLQRLLENRF
jgi:two-component system, LytTR family, response regulator